MATKPYALTIAEAMLLLKQRELSPVELVDSILQRIEQTEDKVHAYTVVERDRARKAAEMTEKAIVKGQWKGPLHGIPVALKDCYHLAGVPAEAGSKVLNTG